jgi:hypothetical protein
MKIFLNILPEEYKKSIRQQKIIKHLFFLIFQIAFLSSFFCSVLIGILWGMHYYEQTNIFYTDDFNEESLRELQEYEEQSLKENDKMNILQKIFEGQYTYTKIFILLDEMFPEDISIKKVEFNVKKGVIYGIAKKRDTILSLQKNMEDALCFTDVHIPIEELVTKEDVAFTLSFTIENEQECLQRKI